MWTKTTKTEDRVWAPNASPMWHPFPPRMSREGELGRLYKEAFRLRRRDGQFIP